MRLYIRVPPDIHQELKRKAIERQTTMQSLLVEAVRYLLDKTGDPTLEVTKEDWIRCNEKRKTLKEQGVPDMEPLTYSEFLRLSGV